MADDIDRANELADREREARIKASASEGAGPGFTGRCLNCDAPLENPLRWCDSECRDEWQDWGSS